MKNVTKIMIIFLISLATIKCSSDDSGTSTQIPSGKFYAEIDGNDFNSDEDMSFATAFPVQNGIHRLVLKGTQTSTSEEIFIILPLPNKNPDTYQISNGNTANIQFFYSKGTTEYELKPSQGFVKIIKFTESQAIGEFEVEVVLPSDPGQVKQIKKGEFNLAVQMHQ